VLTIKAQSSPKNAARYFRDHLTRDDYYTDKERTLGRWFGRTCGVLGLDTQEPVEQKDFVALCQGLHPGDHTRLTQRASPKRRCLYDLTLSAPKSVSLMALLAGDERVIVAHESAVAATLDAAEKLASVRVRRGAAVDTRQARVTGNMVCALFTHEDSRALDPQLHTHGVVLNVTFDPTEQRLKALEARPFYDHARDLTRVYREHLAQSLHALGYDTYQDRYQCPQLHGVSPKLMGQFSKRSSQRDALVALREQELGRPLSKGEVAHIVHENRDKKQRHIDPQALRKLQLEQLTPEDRLSLDQLKVRALANPLLGQDRPRLPGFAPGPELGWVAALRVVVLLSRAVNLDAYLFSPALSFPEQVLRTARFMRQAERTASVVRYAQRSRSLSLSR
jgi:conjugative relaxase-like TrwC/TraI family protein